MSKELKNIEVLFKDGLGNLEQKGVENWDNILKATNKKLFLRFIPRRFNIYYLSAALVALGSLTFILTQAEQSPGESDLEIPVYIQPNISVDTTSTKSTFDYLNNEQGTKSTDDLDEKVAVKSVIPKKKADGTANGEVDQTGNAVEDHINQVMNDSLLRKVQGDFAAKPQTQQALDINEPASVKVENKIEKDTVIIETKELKVIEEKVKRKR